MSTATVPTKRYTPDDLMRMVDAHRFELVDGQLKERPMGTISSWVGGELLLLLAQFCKDRQLGWAFPADQGYVCFGKLRQNLRFPDVSVVCLGRLPGEQLPDGYLTIPPDLAVEVISPNDRVVELDEKVREYLLGGVKLIWVINPTTRSARVYRPDGTITGLTESDEFDGESVLPGFRVRLGDLFPPQPAAPTQP